uniref:Uncharacterized protein n=1 Tax=Heterorhabditis bacteriophora TaxID=37862 RepID=A0A1I7X1E5_HETBA
MPYCENYMGIRSEHFDCPPSFPKEPETADADVYPYVSIFIFIYLYNISLLI